jgi:hypothetical protein
MLAVEKAHPDSKFNAYGIRFLLKVNGFHWYEQAKLWAIDKAEEASAVSLLKVANLDDKFDLVEYDEGDLLVKEDNYKRK